MSSADEMGCATVTWTIENFSMLFYDDVSVHSPVFKTETTDKIEFWRLKARRVSYYGDLHVQMFNEIDRAEYDRLDVSLISSCGEFQLEKGTFKRKKDIYEFFTFKYKELCDKKQSILPQDTLTFRLRLCKKTMKNEDYSIHTVLHRMSFLWNIDRFDSSREYYHMKFAKNYLIFNVFLKRKGTEEPYQCYAEGEHSTKGYPILRRYKISIEGDLNNVTIIEDEYSPLVTNGKEFINIPPETHSFKIRIECFVSVHKEPVKCSNLSSTLSKDLLRMYKENIFSDATLNAEKKSFAVHRNILAARSSVFHAMFQKGKMAESRSGVVDIHDIDSETMDRLLVYIYEDSIEDLSWEEASSLYYAADKYAVYTLKQKCVDILKAGLTAANACDALVLADAHSDEQLMEFVVDFICDHEEVISSAKWKELQDVNPRLIAKTACELFLKKGKAKDNNQVY